MLCRYHNKTPFHCFTFPDQRATALFDKKLQALNGWLQSKLTSPEIQTRIITSLQEWRSRPSEFKITDTNQYTSPGNYITSQTSIGWHQFCNGFLSRTWVQAQQDYYDRKHHDRKASKWASQLIQQLWNISFSIWEHRNAILHKPEILPPMQGLATL